MENSVELRLKFIARDVINLLTRAIPTMWNIIIAQLIKKKRIIYLLDIPTYTNLGDQAIGYAEKKFIIDNFPEDALIEVEGYMVKYYLPFIRMTYKQGDVIIHIGGGNFGDAYMQIEQNRINILNALKGKKIILFPQTIHYSSTVNGNYRLHKMQEALKLNPETLIIAREEVSYKYACENLSLNTILLPDIVLYLNQRTNSNRQKCALLCLRNDAEQENNHRDYIVALLDSLKLKYIETDTIEAKWFPLRDREKVLNKKWEEFQNSTVVVTDRLHGMIFAAITGTPCVALPNYNHKNRSFYLTWFKNINYIRFAQDHEKIYEELTYVLSIKPEDYSKCDFSEQFKVLIEKIK